MINIHHHVYGYVSSSSVSVIRCLGPSQKPLQKRQAFLGSSVLPFYYYQHVSGIRNPEEALIKNSLSYSGLDFTNNASPLSSSSSSSSFNSDSESKNNSGNKVSYLQVREIKERCNKWKWRGHTINYLLINSDSNSNSNFRPPLLLVHGFGASIPHWRRYYYSTTNS